MKSILTLFVFVALAGISYSAQADSCTARLRNPRGMVVRTFIGYGYDRYEACRRAEGQCRNELWRNPFPRPGARCDVDYFRPRPGRRQCTVELQGRSRVLDTFTARGYNYHRACRRAERRCYRELGRLQRQGRAMNGRCVRRRHGGHHDRFVTRSCTVERVGGRGRLHQYHTATASGYNAYSVKQRACRQAMQQCQVARVGNQYCRQRRW